MELIENLLQLLVTFAGACLAGFAYWKSRAQKYFLLFCFYGCFALGALYWTLYLLLFGATPRVFYVSEFGWVASMIFLRILQATLSGPDERAFRCRVVWLAPLVGVPLMVFSRSPSAPYGASLMRVVRLVRRGICGTFIPPCCALLRLNISFGRPAASGRTIRWQARPSGAIFC